MPTAKLPLALLLLAACGGSARPQPTTPPTPATPAAPTTTAIRLPPPAPPQPALTGPVHERARQLRRAGDLLDQAQQALDLGNRNDADVLFSTAELLVGAEAVAALAPRFREGAPPRVTSPIEKVALDQPAQPVAVGNSDDDEAAEAAETRTPPRRARGSLTGTLTIGGKTGGLALVTLEPKGRAWKARAPRQRVMEQRDRTFAPQLMIIPTGSTVTFPNFDTIFHNVFSTSQPAAFDLGLYRQGETRAVTFAREGIVRLGCNIHSNMSATIVVIGAPHYVVPDASGAFTFESLAPGVYTLRAWSERTRTPLVQELTIRAGGNTVAIGVDGDAPPGVMDDKFGAARGQ